jgi:sugar lactone lactonase YvrE
VEPKLLLEGLHFAECPRWFEGKLWFSDIFAQRIMTVDESGDADVVATLSGDDLPAGLGFLPDGRLLVANMGYPAILRMDSPGTFNVHSDVSHLAVGVLNDMVVDRAGRAYVGANGTIHYDAPRPVEGNGSIICVQPDGSAAVAANEMDCPNGPCITSDDLSYIVAELPNSRLIGFDRDAGGLLSNRRVWADLRPGSADGITIDSGNGVWTCSPRLGLCRRVLEGGTITNEISVGDKTPIACCLGGDDGRTLFILSAVGGQAAIRERTNSSVVETIRVEVAA